MVKTTTKQKIGLILLGIFLALIILESGLRVAGFAVLSLQRYSNRITEDINDTYRILALGESTTANLLGGDSSWPEELEIILNKRSHEIKFRIFNEGVPGANSDTILFRLEDNLDKYNPDMVIVMMGVNDEQLLWRFRYEKTSKVKIDLLLENFKVYKLGKLLLAAWKNKVQDVNFIKTVSAAEIDKEFVRTGEYEENLEKYIELGRLYLRQKMFKEAEKTLKKALELDPNNTAVYNELGWLYFHQSRFKEAEKILKENIELDSNNSIVYIELGRFYRRQKMFEKSEEMFKRALELDPNNIWIYFELGRVYYEHGKFKEAEKTLEKALELDPNNTMVSFELAFVYRDYGKFEKSEEMFKKTIELDPNNTMVSFELAFVYRDYGKFKEAEKTFKKIIELDINNELAYLELGKFYQNQSRLEEAEEMFKKAREIRMKYYHPITRNNFQKLYRILKERGIKLAIMQYPLRDIDELKIMFEGNEDIVFISNEENFKKALENGKYEDYFTDNFGGDFGHATLKGNRLIAENVANVILNELGIN